MYGELFQEVLEQEFFVDICLDVIRQFIKDFKVFLRGYGKVLVVLPIVLEMLLESLRHTKREWPVIVVILEEYEPLSHLLRILISGCHLLHFKED